MRSPQDVHLAIAIAFFIIAAAIVVIGMHALGFCPFC